MHPGILIYRINSVVYIPNLIL